MPLFASSHFWFLKERLVLLISMGMIASLGYVIRFASGSLPAWGNDASGSIAYESFWILLVAFLLPRASLYAIAIGVCLTTIALECLQLWQPPFLQAVRATLAGRLFFGNTFD